LDEVGRQALADERNSFARIAPDMPNLDMAPAEGHCRMIEHRCIVIAPGQDRQNNRHRRLLRASEFLCYRLLDVACVAQARVTANAVIPATTIERKAISEPVIASLHRK